MVWDASGRAVVSHDDHEGAAGVPVDPDHDHDRAVDNDHDLTCCASGRTAAGSRSADLHRLTP